MKIIKSAQVFLAEQGLEQWQNGYPNEEVILEDINNNESYVVISDDGEVVGTTMFTVKGESTYNKIEGNWLTSFDAHYGTIHRMATLGNSRNKGIGKFILESCEKLLKGSNINSIRIDTHEGNKAMQNLITKNGYKYCGKIYLQNGDPRLGFEKLI